MAVVKYIVQEGQNIWDVILMNYGTIEAVDQFFNDNPALTFNSDLAALQVVNINTETEGEKTIKNYFITTNFVTNNADEGFVPKIEQKQFMNGEPFDFMNGEPYFFN